MVPLIILIVTVFGSAVPTIKADEVNQEKTPTNLIAKKPCPSRCKQTCSQPNPPANCAPNPDCFCPPNFVYVDGLNNTCVRIRECLKKSCNGDPNAEIKSPIIGCPSTCKNPDQSNCKLKDKSIGCQCVRGYILSKPGGKCIKPNNCPYGNPCKQGNTTYVSCKGRVCYKDYCPQNDENARGLCEGWLGPGPCPSGCLCKQGYLSNNGACVLPEDCPRIKCKRQHEVWDFCPPSCYTDGCHDLARRKPCNDTYPYSCLPRCRCKRNYARIISGEYKICIPVSKCSLNCTGDNEDINPCPSVCWTDQCSDVPYRDSPCNTLLPVECVPECQCKESYARDDNGICIPIDQCPSSDSSENWEE